MAQDTPQTPAGAAAQAESPVSPGIALGERRFGRVNWLGLRTLARREVTRFLVVWTQTLLAPMVTAALFLMIFNIAIGPGRGDVMGVPFIVFLAPGIMMMTVIQNAFANTSSSIVITKVQGNIVDTLMPPLSGVEILLGYLAGAVARGVLVALGIGTGLMLVLGVVPEHPLVALLFVVLGAVFLGGLGIVAGVFAEKFDQMAAITNFIVTPLAFLSGTFYSVQSLPPVLRLLSHLNPVFYLIDGVRFGVIGTSDSSPVLGLVVCSLASLAIGTLAWLMLRSGYRLKS
ncbi:MULTISPECIES: ABC transporter permease [unclassified Phaeobacter]|uniref:ABC transporter permease n=1 Tax=unclassified Phaeobacter TaxID=2621772 RepID=UPI003A8C36E6